MFKTGLKSILIIYLSLTCIISVSEILVKIIGFEKIQKIACDETSDSFDEVLTEDDIEGEIFSKLNEILKFIFFSYSSKINRHNYLDSFTSIKYRTISSPPPDFF